MLVKRYLKHKKVLFKEKQYVNTHTHAIRNWPIKEIFKQSIIFGEQLIEDPELTNIRKVITHLDDILWNPCCFSRTFRNLDQVDWEVSPKAEGNSSQITANIKLLFTAPDSLWSPDTLSIYQLYISAVRLQLSHLQCQTQWASEAGKVPPGDCRSEWCYRRWWSRPLFVSLQEAYNTHTMHKSGTWTTFIFLKPPHKPVSVVLYHFTLRQ